MSLLKLRKHVLREDLLLKDRREGACLTVAVIVSGRTVGSR